ncbi:MAG: flagellar motor switch protein FliG [Gammaproteobacteria bacterium]
MANEEATETSASSLDGAQRAAILMMVLGESEASKVLKFMDPEELELIGSAIGALKDVSQHHIYDVLNDFGEVNKKHTPLDIGAQEYLKKILFQAIGPQKANNILSRIELGPNASGIEALKWVDPEAIADAIKDEHPQLIAILLVHLNDEQAGKILELLDKDKKTNVLIRIAKLGDVNSSALKELEVLIENRFTQETDSKIKNLGGIKAAADILNNVDKDTENNIVESLAEIDKELCEEIKGKMFVFDNLLSVDDRGMQTILREAPQDKLVVALKGASTELANKIFKNMSKRAAELLKDDLETSGPVRLAEVEEAQKGILEVALRLAEEGTIMLGGKGDDFL